MTMSLKLFGLEELLDDLERATRLCPERAEKTLKRSGNRFKARVRKLAREQVKTDENLTKGFLITGPKHTGNDIDIGFSAEGKKNPHWHLIEDGHDIVLPYKRNGVHRTDGGEERGHVLGIKVIPQARNEHRGELEQDLRTMIDEILRETELT